MVKIYWASGKAVLSQRLVFESALAYLDHVKFVRFLALICFGFGLLVQISAQASAMPVIEMAQEMDCGEMMQGMPEHVSVEDEPTDPAGPCDTTSLACVVAMNCVAPLFLGDEQSSDAGFPAEGVSYRPDMAAFQHSRSLPPESPPPRILIDL